MLRNVGNKLVVLALPLNIAIEHGYCDVTLVCKMERPQTINGDNIIWLFGSSDKILIDFKAYLDSSDEKF